MATPLNGALYIKDDKGTILLDLELPNIQVVSSRLSKVIATLGVIGGGALPFLDTFFSQLCGFLMLSGAL